MITLKKPRKRKGLLDFPAVSLVVGPSGTGKTTFMASYAQAHHDRFDSEVYWLVLTSIKDYIQQYLPDWIKVSDNLMDEGFTKADEHPPRRAVIADEMNRLLNKFAFASKSANAFANLIGVHRHKNFDFLASDQEFDFVKGLRSRAHYLVFTGMTDQLFVALETKLSPKIVEWIKEHLGQLTALTRVNRKQIARGVGTAIVYDGSRAYKMRFKRPEWYTQDLSHVWRKVTPEDLSKDTGEEAVKIESSDGMFLNANNFLGREIITNSRDFLVGMLAHHIYPLLFPGQRKIVSQNFSTAFAIAAEVLTGKLYTPSTDALIRDPTFHSLHCPYCKDPDLYEDAISRVRDFIATRSRISSFKRSELIKKQLQYHKSKKLARILGIDLPKIINKKELERSITTINEVRKIEYEIVKLLSGRKVL